MKLNKIQDNKSFCCSEDPAPVSFVTAGEMRGQLWFCTSGDNDDPTPPLVSCCRPHSCGVSGGEELNWPHRETESRCERLDERLKPFILQRSLETICCRDDHQS